MRQVIETETNWNMIISADFTMRGLVNHSAANEMNSIIFFFLSDIRAGKNCKIYHHTFLAALQWASLINEVKSCLALLHVNMNQLCQSESQ